jgi:hypothetical protein
MSHLNSPAMALRLAHAPADPRAAFSGPLRRPPWAGAVLRFVLLGGAYADYVVLTAALAPTWWRGAGPRLWLLAGPGFTHTDVMHKDQPVYIEPTS